MSHCPLIGAYCGILGETGLRMTEGLRLKWDHVSIPNRNLTVEARRIMRPGGLSTYRDWKQLNFSRKTGNKLATPLRPLPLKPGKSNWDAGI